MTKQAIEQASKNFLIGVVERHRRQFGTFEATKQVTSRDLLRKHLLRE